MERNIQRINGEVTHLHELSQGELNNMRAYAAERIHQGMTDIDKIEAELRNRRPLGDLALIPQIEATALGQQHFEQRFKEVQ